MEKQENDFDIDFDSFIDMRLNSNYNKLSSNKVYVKLNKSYDKIYDKIKKQLTREQKNLLNKLLHIRNSIADYENCFSYKLSIKDIIKFLK